MNVIAITQARINSTRLPEKVLKILGDKTLLELHLKRIKKSKRINKIVVATTFENNVEKILEIANKQGVFYSQGSTDDVLDRYYQAAKNFRADIVIRLTSDCPLIDPQIIDDTFDFFMKEGNDYVSNTLKPTFPDGMDVEVMKFTALENAWKNASLKSEREHVTPYIWKNSTFFKVNKFTSSSFESGVNNSNIRLTVDNLDDFCMLQKLIEITGEDKTCLEYVMALKNNPQIFSFANPEERNLGYLKSINKD
jgi:spore coat polysaccharide biosynthesis protein SpsF